MVILLFLAACGTGASDLESKTWVLKSYGEPGNPQSVLKDTEITAEFNSAEGQVVGSAGCNRYFGSYEVKGDKLSIPGPIGHTEMWCEGAMEQEEQYLEALQAAESYKIEDGELRLTCGNQMLVFISR